MTHTCDGSLPGCFGCAAIARRLADVRAVMTVDDRLDDIARARIWSKVDDAIALRASHRSIGWRWPVAIASAAAVAAAIALVARTRAPDDELRVLSAPRDVTLTAPLGPHARAALVGPAQLAVTSQIGELTTVRLDLGTFYAQFDGGPGRALRVVAPGAVVDVVGTLFAIETDARATCVSVAHGRVRVTAPDRTVFVGADERWCTGDASPAAIEPRTKDALARHELVLASRNAAPPPAPAASAAPIAEPPPPPTPTPDIAVPTSNGMTSSAPIATNRRPNTPPAGTMAPDATNEPPIAPPATASVATTPTGATPSPATTLPPPASSNIGSNRPPASTTTTTTASVDSNRTPPAPDLPATTAPDLYREAEAALARRDPAAADRALAKLLADDPHSPLADQALYERARIAYQRHAWAEARRHLDALATIAATPLAEPGRYLACRIAVEARDADAARCLSEYRVAYPRSAHDLDVLGLLVQLVHADAGCAGARKLVDELARAYPASALARGWRARCPEGK